MKKNYINPRNIVISLDGADSILVSASEGNPATPEGFNPTLGGDGGSAGEGPDLGRTHTNLWDKEW